jgi:NAD+ diphosphatase
MPLSDIANVFTGNPLNRVSERRPDSAWLDAKLEEAGSLAIALWNGKPLTETRDGKLQLAYITADMAQELSGGWERLLFLGLWKETAVFALDIEGAADPADGPLQGIGRFEELRTVAMALPGGESAIAATAKAMFEWRRKHRH